MRRFVLLALLAIASGLAGVPRPALAQWQPPSRFGAGTATLALTPAAPRRPDYVRRARLVAGIRQGALVGMLAGLGVGVLHTALTRDEYAGAFTVLLWTMGGTAAGATTGGIVAARRYDRAQEPSSDVAQHTMRIRPAHRPQRR